MTFVAREEIGRKEGRIRETERRHSRDSGTDTTSAEDRSESSVVCFWLCACVCVCGLHL